MLISYRFYDSTSKRTSFWAITIKFGLAQYKKIGLETSANVVNLRFLNE